MSVRVCVHPSIMRDSAGIRISRYGSASSLAGSVCMSPTALISASAVAAISQREANASSMIYQPLPKQSGGTASKDAPADKQSCTLPEIPNSPSSRSVASSDSPFVLRMRNVGDSPSEGGSQYSSSRSSTFPNFRALQRLALSARTKALSLNQNPRRSSSTGKDNQAPGQLSSPSTLEESSRLSAQQSRTRSIGEMWTPTGFNSLASLPGNRHNATDVQKSAAFGDVQQTYPADHSVSSKLRKKKSAKKRKRKPSRAKSRGQKNSQSTKQKPLLQENPLGSILSAMPVAVEPKKIEIYSSRYNKFDSETGKTHQHSPREEKGVISPPKTASPRRDSSEVGAGRKAASLDRGPVIYASRVSPRIPAGAGLGVAGPRDKADGPRVTRVYLSDKQSGNLRECGLILPCAPPATPTPHMMQKYQYVPSMTDLRSQRAIRDRLSGMEQKAKKKQQLQREEARKTEQQLQRDQAAAWKARQRLEIYALNKIMTDFEEKNFLEFMKKMSGKAP